MLSSASKLCKDLSTVQRIHCFLTPFSIFFMLRQLAGWPCTAGVFIQTGPGLNLTKDSLHFSSCYLFFDFFCLSLSASHPLCLSHTLVPSYSRMRGCSFSTEGIWTNSLSQVPFKEPPSWRLPESPWGLSAE